MAGSFAFGLLYHFVIPGPDNVVTQPPGTWRTAFGVSAALLLPLQGAGCLVGLWAASRRAGCPTAGHGPSEARFWMDVLGLRRVMSNPSEQEHRGRSRPTGALRLAFRPPIYLYRLGLGQLLGHRFMLLTHRGRRSGRVYQTALEVVRYDPSLRETVVASGWGERSDWYRNSRLIPRWRSEPDASAMPQSSGS